MTIRVRNPLDGCIDFEFEPATRAEVFAASERVRAAQPAWHALGVEGRAVAMRAFAASVDANADALYAALSRDTGRRATARAELGAVCAIVDGAIQDAAIVLRNAGERPSAAQGIALRTQLVPYPVVGVIAPWNFPLVLSLVDAIPALLAGCGVVIKPSEVTPRYVEPLLAIVSTVPALAAVMAVVRGAGATGADLIDAVDAIVCTGSVRTGRSVAQQAASRFIPAFLELGGKDAVIVTRDADLERAATSTLRGGVLVAGQACQSVERVYVDAAVADDFVRRLVAKAALVRLTCDDPDGGHVGPFISAAQANVVREHVADAVEHGARLECGGRIVERGGVWCEPTVLARVHHGMRVMREETFGPVVPVATFESIDEAIALANDSEYGLSANVFAGSESEGLAIAARLDAGFVSVGDCSLSGFVRDVEWEPLRGSGLGRSRSGPAGIARYLRAKAIVTNRGSIVDIRDFPDSPDGGSGERNRSPST